MGGAGAFVTLFDEAAGDTSPTFKGSFSEKLEVTPGFGADSVGISPNGNTQGSLEIPFVKIYASKAAAKADIRAMRALKGLQLNLKMTQDTDVDYWPSAVLTHMTFDMNGQCVVYSFQFATQDITATEPS